MRNRLGSRADPCQLGRRIHACIGQPETTLPSFHAWPCRFNRVLHDPAVLPREALTQQQYVDKTAQQTTMTHFAEKLFKLKVLPCLDRGALA